MTAAQSLFGTDGIRGRAGRPPLDPSTIRRIGLALGSVFSGRLLIGRDTRLSGVWMEEVLSSALHSAGCRPHALGVISTPAVAHFTRRDRQAAAGIVISASHNPYRDNGLKVFGPQGEKLSSAQQKRVEEAVQALPSDEAVGEQKAARDSIEDGQSPCEEEDVETELLLAADPEARQDYLDFLASAVAPGALKGLKVVLDCANGAAYRSAPMLFRRLGAEVVTLGADPDGRNINEGCGAMHPEPMARRVMSEGADLGAAFDGDADRLILSDEAGRLLDGDHILLMLARQMMAAGKLPKRTVVATVMSNLGLEKALARDGIRLLRTAVGDRFVWEAMKDGGHPLGGEQAGHIILGEMLPSGDGQLAAVKIAALAAAGRETLSGLADSMVRYPQLLLNVPVASKPDWRDIPALASQVDEVESELASKGRVLVRYSGTEPKVRIMLEGEPGYDLQPSARHLAECFRRELGE